MGSVHPFLQAAVLVAGFLLGLPSVRGRRRGKQLHIDKPAADARTHTPCSCSAVSTMQLQQRRVVPPADSLPFPSRAAHTCHRRPAIEPPEENAKLLTVNAPAPYPPLCLRLALGTRVCVVRVDAMNVIIDTVSSICCCAANRRHGEQRLHVVGAACWQSLVVGMQPCGVLGVHAVTIVQYLVPRCHPHAGVPAAPTALHKLQP